MVGRLRKEYGKLKEWDKMAERESESLDRIKKILMGV